ncbi:hypothetical protein C8R43DRAFT_1009307, partial [Mycena crocata]
MENDAPPPQNDILAQLREQKVQSIRLKADVDVLRMEISHHLEDIATLRTERDEYRAKYDEYHEKYHKAGRELVEVRGKYNTLKRQWPQNQSLKRKPEGDPAADGGERRERVENPCQSPVERSPAQSTSRLPDDDAIMRRASLSSTDERDPIWPQSPVVPELVAISTSSSSASLSANAADRTNDPRKRIKLDLRTSTTSPSDLRLPANYFTESTAQIASSRPSTSTSASASSATASSSSISRSISNASSSSNPSTLPNFKRFPVPSARRSSTPNLLSLPPRPAGASSSFRALDEEKERARWSPTIESRERSLQPQAQSQRPSLSPNQNPNANREAVGRWNV